MRYLFIHPVFPGQFEKMMAALARDPANEVVHLGHRESMEGMDRVRKISCPVEGNLPPVPHPFLQKLHQALVHGDVMAEALLRLRSEGFVPDAIISYAGHGQNFYVKDIFPDVPFLGYCEWYLGAFGAEYNFDPAYPLEFTRQRFLRIFNANMLIDLEACDAGLTPTRWQQSRFPLAYRNKLHVLHDGIDTGYFSPSRPQVLDLGDRQLPLADIELITYSTRGMEPFRGFPEFMRALAILQQQRPKLHAVIAGTDEIFYSRLPADAKTFKESLLRELEGQLDLSRVHFTGWLQKRAYREILRASSAHVYLSYPYVLSWSLLESMSTGCLVIGSRTAPVEEVIRDGDNGLLVDFPGHEQLADTLARVLENPQQFAPLRERARQTVLSHYDQRELVPQQLRWLDRQIREFRSRRGSS